MAITCPITLFTGESSRALNVKFFSKYGALSFTSVILILTFAVPEQNNMIISVYNISLLCVHIVNNKSQEYNLALKADLATFVRVILMWSSVDYIHINCRHWMNLHLKEANFT